MSELAPKEQLDYTCYPDALAPRRFELIRTEGERTGVYAHGVMLYNKQVVIGHPISDSVSVYGPMTREELAERHKIRWLDPPFPSKESEDDE